MDSFDLHRLTLYKFQQPSSSSSPRSVNGRSRRQSEDQLAGSLPPLHLEGPSSHLQSRIHTRSGIAHASTMKFPQHLEFGPRISRRGWPKRKQSGRRRAGGASEDRKTHEGCCKTGTVCGGTRYESSCTTCWVAWTGRVDGGREDSCGLRRSTADRIRVSSCITSNLDAWAV